MKLFEQIRERKRKKQAERINEKNAEELRKLRINVIIDLCDFEKRFNYTCNNNQYMRIIDAHNIELFAVDYFWKKMTMFEKETIAYVVAEKYGLPVDDLSLAIEPEQKLMVYLKNGKLILNAHAIQNNSFDNVLQEIFFCKSILEMSKFLSDKKCKSIMEFDDLWQIKFLFNLAVDKNYRANFVQMVGELPDDVQQKLDFVCSGKQPSPYLQNYFYYNNFPNQLFYVKANQKVVDLLENVMAYANELSPSIESKIRDRKKISTTYREYEDANFGGIGTSDSEFLKEIYALTTHTISSGYSATDVLGHYSTKKSLEM